MFFIPVTGFCLGDNMKMNNWGTLFIAAGVLLFVAYIVYSNPFAV